MRQMEVNLDMDMSLAVLDLLAIFACHPAYAYASYCACQYVSVAHVLMMCIFR